MLSRGKVSLAASLNFTFVVALLFAPKWKLFCGLPCYSLPSRPYYSQEDLY